MRLRLIYPAIFVKRLNISNTYSLNNTVSHLNSEFQIHFAFLSEKQSRSGLYYCESLLLSNILHLVTALQGSQHVWLNTLSSLLTTAHCLQGFDLTIYTAHNPIHWLQRIIFRQVHVCKHFYIVKMCVPCTFVSLFGHKVLLIIYFFNKVDKNNHYK